MSNSKIERNPLHQYRRFESFREYESLLDEMIPHTESAIRIFDRTLARAWNEKCRIDILRQFLLRDRANKLMIVLHLAQDIRREQPRFIELLGDFSHAVKIRLTPKMAQHIYDPFVIFDASHYLHRFHHAHMRSAQGIHDVDGSRQLRDRFDELWEVSVPLALSSTSGL